MRPVSSTLAVLLCLIPGGVSLSAAVPPAGTPMMSASTHRTAGSLVAAFASSAVAGEAAEQPAAPVMTLDKSSLGFGALTNGGTFVRQTSAQIVRLTQSGAGTVGWTAASAQPWLKVTPANGTGGGALTVSIAPGGGLPPTGTVTGSIVVTYNGASTVNGVINVTLNLQANGTSAPPFGFVDTPRENATGVTGAVPFTGWALDDVEIAAVAVCRAPVAGEGAGADGRCGGGAQIYIGDAVFIEGARSDLQAAYPTYPRNSQAGWGLMVLTNMLPAQGNGTYNFSMWARDVEGATTLLGTRTMTCDNAHAVLPFGTIDTPAQGETISGNPYVNFGWALTPQPKFIENRLLATLAYVDGVILGPIEYGFYRSDIATLFPGLRNSDAAVGYRLIYTSEMTNGLHTLVWVVSDDSGATEGLGSRYITVSNESTASRRTEASRAAASIGAPVVDAATLAAVPLDSATIQGRRGWSPDAIWREFASETPGAPVVVHGEELDRFEFQLDNSNGARISGYQRVGSSLQPLPIGSHLDAAKGVFTWAPGVGFIGAYDLVFVRGADGQAESRQEVRVILRPKGLTEQIVIDLPQANAVVNQPLLLAGWAADLSAPEGTGIDTLHVWAYPVSGAAPVFLGVAADGAARPDVAAAYGAQFGEAGYSLTVQGLDAGSYDIAVFGWSRARSGFLPASVVRVTVR